MSTIATSGGAASTRPAARRCLRPPRRPRTRLLQERGDPALRRAGGRRRARRARKLRRHGRPAARGGCTRAARRRAPRRGRRGRAGRSRATGSAPPTPSSVISTWATAVAAGRGSRRVALGVLGDVGQRLADDEVGGGLDRLRQPAGQLAVDRRRQRRARGERVERGAEPVLSTAGWMPRASSRSSDSEGRARRGGRDELCGRGSPRRATGSAGAQGDATRRCCAPSCRSRSSRRRSASPAATMRSREAAARPRAPRSRRAGAGSRARSRPPPDRLDQLGLVVERRVVDERPSGRPSRRRGPRSLAAGLQLHLPPPAPM